ncbi:MAG TPA: LLM class flavin-dependent oxidoreductase [Candidatus Sulfomarinibacteraceae bacterium]|nr:LLM class flavin-dependent oxidoreductase [Candidatus Sulfomarinibacteraceae bacterium]
MANSSGAGNNRQPFELGLYSFAELTPDPQTGEMITPRERMQDLLASIELADQVGLDVFGLGEHHRPDFISSAPSVALAAAAARTEHIRLSSAVNVISSDDPVRVFQRFAMLDLVSNGRAEIMAGRGSFIESFPLFGYDLHDYNELFEEKLELLLEIRANEQVRWSGKHRAPLTGQGVYPRPQQQPLPVWIAVGGTPESVVRAGRLGLPLALAIIGGRPAQFAPLVELYWETVRRHGHDPSRLQVSINSHGYIADDAQQARDEAFPYYELMMNRIGRERGWAPLTRAQYDASTTLEGANFIGSPHEIIEKILYQHEIFNHGRLLLQFTIGTMPHDKVLRSIELFGTKVAPVVREEIGRRAASR